MSARPTARAAFLRLERNNHVFGVTGARAPPGERAYPRNAKKHSEKQINQIATSIRRFGFNTAILVDANDRVIAGHAHLEAAKNWGSSGFRPSTLPFDGFAKSPA